MNGKINETTLNDSSVQPNYKENFISQNYALTPLLNESLNNLAKRLERSRVPKPPLAKGQGLRKKSKNYSSVPNIFFSSSDNFVVSDKSIQWTNKYNIDIETLKNVFKSNYEVFYDQKKRSSSIPILNREQDDLDSHNEQGSGDNTSLSSKHQMNNEEEGKIVKDNDIKSNFETLDKHEESLNDKAANENNESFKEHDYLEGAIIEPISPASASKDVGDVVCDIEKNVDITVEVANNAVFNNENVVKIVKGKRGRKKKGVKKKSAPVITHKDDKEITEDVLVQIQNDKKDDNQLNVNENVKDNNNEGATVILEECTSVELNTLKDNKNGEQNKTNSEQLVEEVKVLEKEKIETNVKVPNTIKKRGRKPKRKVKLSNILKNEEKESDIDQEAHLQAKEIECFEILNNNVEIIELKEKSLSPVCEKSVEENVQIYESLKELDERNHSSTDKKVLGEIEMKEFDENKYEKKDLNLDTDEQKYIESNEPNLEEKKNEVEEVIEIKEQSNDLEILSNSLSNSVDTSMLPPRKRYKRFMYLENSKQFSPKPESQVTQTPDIIDSEAILPTSSESSMTQPKPASRLKGKKKKTAESNKTSRPQRQNSTKTIVAEDKTTEPDNCNLSETNLETVSNDRIDDKKVDDRKIYDRKVDDRKVDVRKVDNRKVDDKKVDDKKVIDRKVDDRKVDVRKVDNRKVDDKKVDDMKVDDKKVHDKRVDNKKVHDKRIDDRKVDNKKVHDKRVDDRKVDDIKVDDEKVDDKKVDDKKVDDRKVDDKKVDDKKVDDGKVDDKKLVEKVKHGSSLKRSKREAAARGFASMVAMSLNNSGNSNNAISDNISEGSSKKTAASQKVPDTESVSSSAVLESMTTTSQRSSKKLSSKKIDKYIDKKSTTKRNSKSYEDESKEPENPVPKKQKLGNLVNQKEKAEINLSLNDSNSTNSPVKAGVKYRKIRTNTYADPKSNKFMEIAKCGCKPSKFRNLYEYPKNKKTKKDKKSDRPSEIVWDCGDNCLNRLTYTECSQRNCPCGDACANKKIRKCEWVSGLKLIDIPGKGKGVMTTVPIKEGTFIVEYVGEVVTEDVFHERMRTKYNKDAHHYCLHLDGDMLIDAYRCGSIARFINHNCRPNCEMQKWLVNGAYRMCVFATEDIPPNTEIYYDYNFCSYNNENAQLCLCGAPNCRGFIGSRPSAIKSESQKDRQKLYYIFGKRLNPREKLFASRHSIFLLRNRESGRCRRLNIRNSHNRRGKRLPSTISEFKRRKAKKTLFLTQLSTVNTLRWMKTRQLQSAQDNEILTRTAQLGQVLKDLYNSLLEQTDPNDCKQQLVAPFLKALNPKKYPEFYRMISVVGVGNDTVGKAPVTCLSQVYNKLLEGEYTTMIEFDKDILTILFNVLMYAGKQSNVGKCIERVKSIYRDLKVNAIGLYEALTDVIFDEKDKNRLLSNNLHQITCAVLALRNANDTAVKNEQNDVDTVDNIDKKGIGSTKKRKQKDITSDDHYISGNISLELGLTRSRLDRGAEVIKCVCGFLVEANHIMVQCDLCYVWQHAACMNVARSPSVTRSQSIISTVTVDVTRQEPYYCHVCLGTPNDQLQKEIPRHFIISEEESVLCKESKTLFWTLWLEEPHQTLLKIDDFVFVKNVESGVKDQRTTIMRIYSLWKDETGQRWMEGGLFLRPYDKRLGGKTKSTSTKKSNNRSTSNVQELFHKDELVYTELTEILKLNTERILGICHVLNSHTFKQGKPVSLYGGLNSKIFVCDWMVAEPNKEWIELDPSYLKVNTKPYCFEKINKDEQRKFERVYSADELKSLDQGTVTDSELLEKKGLSPRPSTPDQIDKKTEQMISLEKLIQRIREFARDRNQKLPSSSTSSNASSSRGSSPLIEEVGTNSPLLDHSASQSYSNLSEENINVTRRRRKPLRPTKKITISNNSTIEISENLSKEKDAACDDEQDDVSADQSPQLMIVTYDTVTLTDNGIVNSKTNNIDEDKSQASDQQPLSVEEINSNKTGSTPKATTDEQQSNLGSEINFGELADLLKDKTVQKEVGAKEETKFSKSKHFGTKNKKTKPISTKSKAKKNTSNKLSPAKVPKNSEEFTDRKLRARTSTKRAVAVSKEHESKSKEVVEDKVEEPPAKIPNITLGEKLLTHNEACDNTPKKSLEEDIELSNIVEDENINENMTEEEVNDDTKKCFVKLERMQVEANKANKSNDKLKNVEDSNVKEVSKTDTTSNYSNPSAPDTVPTATSSNNRQNENNSTTSTVSYNRSKRKKGVPKRIPVDFSFSSTSGNIANTHSTDISLSSVPHTLSQDFDTSSIVDLSKSTSLEVIHASTNIQPISSNTLVKPYLTELTGQTLPQPKHSTAMNDFSSIENISSD